MKPEKDSQEQLLKRLERQVEELSANLERTRLAEYVQMLDNPRRLLYVNFLVGISRGLGAALGATILAAVLLYFLQKVVMLNLPLIGDFIADLVRIVQTQLDGGKTFPGAGF